MPEIKHTFVKGRMNKDFDERLVPNGEYRDALNIEVSTSEGSNVGTAQNLKGNILATTNNHLGAQYTLSNSATTVGSYQDEATKAIFNFIHKASDLTASGTYGGNTRFLGVRSDVISKYTALSSAEEGVVYPLVTDVYEARIAPTDYQTSQNGIITGVDTQVHRTNGQSSIYGPKGVRPGMRVRLIGPDGFDAYAGEVVIVKEINTGLSASDVGIVTTIPNSSLYWDSTLDAAGYVFQFTSERILNFQVGVTEEESNVSGTPSTHTPQGTMITGINYVDGILFYTDGRTEPKRIVTKKFYETNGDYDAAADNARHSLWRSGLQTEWMKEDLITVIKKNPLTPLIAKASLTSRQPEEISPGYYYLNTVVSPILELDGSGGTQQFSLADASNVKYSAGHVLYIKSTIGRVHWKEGDVIRMIGNDSAAVAKIKIDEAYSGSGASFGSYDQFKVLLVDIDEAYTGTEPAEIWSGTLVEKESLYEDKFVYFAYRYRYTDGEYSCISPYSQSIFIPGFYAYSPKNGYNRGMESLAKYITLDDFVRTTGMDADIEAVEILIKDAGSETVQIIKEVKRDSPAWNAFGTHAKGHVKLTSESFGSSLPSSQLTRVFDAVPRYAKAQEFSGSRLLYGNYTEGYNLKNTSNQDITPEITTSVDIVANDFTATLEGSNNLTTTQGSDYGLSTALLNSANDAFQEYYPGQGLSPSHNAPAALTGPYDIAFPYSNPNGIYSQGTPNNQNLHLAYHNTHGSSHPTWDGWALVGFNQETDPGNNWDFTTMSYIVPENGSYNFTCSVDLDFLLNRRFDTGVNDVNTKGGRTKLVLAKMDPNNPGQPLFRPNSSFYTDENWDPDQRLYVLASGSYQDTDYTYNSNSSIYLGSGLIGAAAFFPNGASDWTVSTDPLTLTATITTGPTAGFQPGDHIGLLAVTDPSGQYSAVSTAKFSYLSNLGLGYSGQQASGMRCLGIRNASIQINAPFSIEDVTVKQGAPSVKSLRTYEVGVVYLDGKGRESTVVLDESAELKNSKDNCLNQTKIKVKIKHRAPYWAKYYKFFIKEIGPEYNNVVLYKAYPNDNLDTSAGQTVYAWLSFNSADRNKISKNDYLVLKKEHGSNNAVTDLNARFRVLDIISAPEEIEDDPNTTVVEGFSLRGVPITATAQDISGKFFVKIEADQTYADYITDGGDDTIPTLDENINNGACFEVEKPINVDLDLFYEASQAYPIELTKNDAELYIRPGSKITYQPANLAQAFAIGEWDTTILSVHGAEAIASSNYTNIPVNDNGYFCKIEVGDPFLNPSAMSTLVSSADPLELKITSEDNSVVTAWAFKVSNTTIYIYPFTHKVRPSDSLISEITLGWTNCYTFGNGVESDRIRDDFNASSTYPYLANGKSAGFKASLFLSNYREIDNQNDIIFSQIYNDATNTARYNEFLVAENITKKLNSEYGSIQKLYTREGDVLAFCENKVLKILANKDALFNADGKPQLLSSTNVLGEAVPFAGDYGISTNPESFAVEEYRIYFTDQYRGAVCRLSGNGITSISDHGMRDWFNDNLETTTAAIGSYDGKKNEYNLTLHSSTNPGWKKNVYTLSFSENVKGWVSFKSFILESGLSLSNEYYTFKNGNMYLHHPDQTAVDRNNFYGTQYNSSVDVLFNDQPSSVKLFRAISYEGSQSKEL